MPRNVTLRDCPNAELAAAVVNKCATVVDKALNAALVVAVVVLTFLWVGAAHATDYVPVEQVLLNKAQECQTNWLAQVTSLNAANKAFSEQNATLINEKAELEKEIASLKAVPKE